MTKLAKLLCAGHGAHLVAPRGLSALQRRTLLLEAAEKVILKKGYALANMSEIAALAGMSKRTLYQHFTSKEAVFEALIESSLPELLGDDLYQLPAETLLVQLLEGVAIFILSSQQIALHRVIIAEANRYPSLSQAFYRLAFQRQAQRLHRWFATQVADGSMVIDDPSDAAAMVFGMAMGDLHIGALLGHKRPPTHAEISRRVRRAVKMFLLAVAPHAE